MPDLLLWMGALALVTAAAFLYRRTTMSSAWKRLTWALAIITTVVLLPFAVRSGLATGAPLLAIGVSAVILLSIYQLRLRSLETRVALSILDRNQRLRGAFEDNAILRRVLPRDK